MKSCLLFCLPALGAGLLAGCGSADPEPVGEDLAPLVEDRVKVIDAEPGRDLVVEPTSFSAARARFPELANRAPGDIVVSGKGGGLLRRVRGVRTEGDRIVVDTEPASIEEVFKQASVRASIGDAQVPGPAPMGTGAGGIGLQAIKLRLPRLSVEARTIDLGNGSAIDITDTSFELEPKLDFDLVVRRARLEKLRVVASGESHAHAKIKYRLKKTPGLVSGAFVRLDNHVGTPIAETAPVYAVIWVGYVPIVVTVRARLLADWGFRFGGDTYGEQDLSADGAVSLGLDYRDGQWSPVASRSLTVGARGNAGLASHQVMGEVNLTARLDISFYETAGPYVAIQGYGGLEHDGSEAPSGGGWFVVGGARGLAGAQVAIFGRRLAGYEAVLFDVSKKVPIGGQ